MHFKRILPLAPLPVGIRSTPLLPPLLPTLRVGREALVRGWPMEPVSRKGVVKGS